MLSGRWRVQSGLWRVQSGRWRVISTMWSGQYWSWMKITGSDIGDSLKQTVAPGAIGLIAKPTGKKRFLGAPRNLSFRAALGAWVCAVCKWMQVTLPKEAHKGRRGNDIRASRFACFDFAIHGESEKFNKWVRQHEQQEGHRLATAASKRFVLRMPQTLRPLAPGGGESHPENTPREEEKSPRPLAQQIE